MEHLKLSGIVITKDTERRLRLKHAVQHSHTFEKLVPMASMEQTLELLSPSSPFDIIFVSECFNDDIPRLLEKVRQTQNPALVVLVTEGAQREAEVSSKLLAGVSAFLLEPYSVEAIENVCEVALSLKALQQERRDKAALQRLVISSLAYLDELATRKAHGKPTPSKRHIRSIAEISRKLDPSQLEQFFKILEEQVQSAVAPPESPRLMLEAMRAQREKAAGKPEGASKHSQKSRIVRKK